MLNIYTYGKYSTYLKPLSVGLISEFVVSYLKGIGDFTEMSICPSNRANLLRPPRFEVLFRI